MKDAKFTRRVLFVFTLLLILVLSGAAYSGFVSRVTTWSSNQTLTAAALNAEFDNILDNGVGVNTTQTLTNKTLTTPTLTVPVIADFSSANHDHSNTVNGGAVDTTNNYRFNAYLGASTQSIVNDANVRVKFATELFDPNNVFDNVSSATGFRLTPTAGCWYLKSQIHFGSLEAAPNYGALYIYKNTTTVIAVDFKYTVSANDYYFDASTDECFTGTDYVEVFAYNAGTASKNLNGRRGTNFFTGHRFSE